MRQRMGQILKVEISALGKRCFSLAPFKVWGPFVLTLLLGCGIIEEEEKEIDQSFEDYLNLFIHEAEQRGYSISADHLVMRYGEIENPSLHIAVCITYVPTNPAVTAVRKRSDWRKVFGAGKPPEVVVPPNNWEALSPTQKEITIFHELGHCLLNKDHTNDDDSVMSPFIISARLYSENRAALLDELFDPSSR